MLPSQFNVFTENLIARLRALLTAKGDEYAPTGDRLADFKQRAEWLNATPEFVIYSDASKHFRALGLLVRDLPAPSPPTLAKEFDRFWVEKCGDLMAFMVLMLATVFERSGGATGELDDAVDAAVDERFYRPLVNDPPAVRRIALDQVVGDVDARPGLICLQGDDRETFLQAEKVKSVPDGPPTILVTLSSAGANSRLHYRMSMVNAHRWAAGLVHLLGGSVSWAGPFRDGPFPTGPAPDADDPPVATGPSEVANKPQKWDRRVFSSADGGGLVVNIGPRVVDLRLYECSQDPDGSVAEVKGADREAFRAFVARLADALGLTCGWDNPMSAPTPPASPPATQQ